MKLHKGDNIKIMAGKDRGKTGKILSTLPDENKIIVEGLNIFKKRARPTKQGEKGQTVLVPRPMQASKVMFICASCSRPTRIGSRVEGSKKIRYCKKCKATI